MEYECKTIPIQKVLLSPAGTVQPLCNDCVAPDCTNPIRDYTVAMMGVPQKMRLWIVNNLVRQVVDCRGYLKDADVLPDIEADTISTPKTDRGT